MSEESLSKEQLARCRQAIREVAERVVVMLSEQVASRGIDCEAAEDFMIWADERLQQIDQLSAEQITQIAGSPRDRWQGDLDVALTGRGFIRGQTGDSQNPRHIEQCRNLQRITQMAALFAATLQPEARQNDATEEDGS